jgi:small subunit ribosomal protein S16e
MDSNVQTFGRKKTSVAVACVKKGTGMVRINSRPLDLIQPVCLRAKVEEPMHIVGLDKFRNLDMKIRVSGGGSVSQIYGKN